MRNILRYYTVFFVLGITAPALFAQTGNPKDILDRTVQEFDRAGSMQVKFVLTAEKDGSTVGATDGVIRLKGEKFVMETEGMTTWFDGTTQWTYVPENEEVNVGNPTPEELQSINPYELLRFYKKGYTAETGNMSAYKGKPIYHIILKAKKKEDISRLILYIDKTTYMPRYIVTEMRGNTTNRIEVEEYNTKSTFEDSLFVFDASKYPGVEIID